MDELSVLRAQLVAEREKRAAAEAQAADSAADAARERELRVVAETTAAAAETTAAAAAADAARERELRAAAEKCTFFTQMRAIFSSSSADTASNTDEARRAAPAPAIGTVEEVLTGGSPTPAVAVAPAPEHGGSSAAAAAAAAWAAFSSAYLRKWAPRAAAAAASRLNENRDVHPVVAALLAAAVPRGLRVWGNAYAEDEVASARIRPDFTVTHARDSAPSTLGALVLVEVKLPGSLDDALRQARAYLRRRVYKLCCERDARGEACDGVFALGMATDGAQLALLRMRSGAPPLGGSYIGAVPCPAVQTVPLTLLGDWDFCSAPLALLDAERAPPAGFAALSRLCSLPHALLGDGAPLESLRAIVCWASGDGGGGKLAAMWGG